jgi:nitrite reductase (cytochrome c-552)
MKKRTLVILLSIVLLLSISMLVGCAGSGDADQEVENVAGAATVTSEPILDIAQWREQFPSHVETFKMNAARSEHYSYLETYPWLRTIYEGGGFAKGYESARSHAYAVADVNATPRISEKSPANCFACKSPNYPITEARDGAALYTRPFFEENDKMTYSVACYDCHLNDPGRGKENSSLLNGGGFLGSIRTHFNEAFEGTEPATAACAQCHNEYYFDPETKAVTLPKGLISPEEIYNYYQTFSFSDYTSPSTGTEHLKVQHPEFQVHEDTAHAKKGMTCASCHLERKRSNQGEYVSHNVTNPVRSEIIRKSVCAPCHSGDSALQLIKDAQERTKAQTAAVAERLAAFNQRFGYAVSSGRLSDDTLVQLRSLNREATWYWDWVFVENSNGAHHPEQAKWCLDKANALLEQAEALLP